MARLLREPIPQSEPLSPDQVKNSADGYVWQADIWQRLTRFLVLGIEGATYYANQGAQVSLGKAIVEEALVVDPERAINLIVDVSDNGRAPKNDYAIYALACATIVDPQRAYAALPGVIRTGGHMLMFVDFVNSMRGWGRGLREAVAGWYLERPADALAYQVTKYAQRGGWTHRDVLRLAHSTREASAEQKAVLAKVAHPDTPGTEGLPKIYEGIDALRGATSMRKAAEIIGEYRLPHEVVPKEMLVSPEVWSAILEDMPVTAMLRNLATMTRVGLLKPNAGAVVRIGKTLLDPERLKRGRVHPLAILAALVTYQSGHGARDTSKTWEPVTRVVDILNDAFYLSFQAVEPIGRPVLLAVDVSGSMGMGQVGGVVGLTPAMAAAAMALVTANVEEQYEIFGFASNFTKLPVSPKMRLDEAMRTMYGRAFGSTDCAVPALWATTNKIDCDLFSIYTDSETWFGRIHPDMALRQYREKMGREARQVVVGMVMNSFSIANPNDPGQLDVVGFDTATPHVIGAFGRGEI